MANPLSNSSGTAEALTALQNLGQTFRVLATMKCTQATQEGPGWVNATLGGHNRVHMSLAGSVEPKESCEHSQLGVLTFGLSPNSASQIAWL